MHYPSRLALILFLLLTLFMGSALAQHDTLIHRTSGGLGFSYPADFVLRREVRPLLAVLNNETAGITLRIAASPTMESLIFGLSAGNELAAQIDRMDFYFRQTTGTSEPAIEANVTLANDKLEYLIFRSDQAAVGYALFTPEDGPAVGLDFVQQNTDEVWSAQRWNDLILSIIDSLTWEPPPATPTPRPRPTVTATPPDWIAIADMPPGVIQFAGGVSARYPEGWEISTFFGDSVFDFITLQSTEISQATINISLMDSAMTSIEQWRVDDLALMAQLVLGLPEEKINESSLLIEREMADGRRIEQFDLGQRVASEVDVFSNVYVVPLSETYWVMIFALATTEEAWQVVERDTLSIIQSLKVEKSPIDS